MLGEVPDLRKAQAPISLCADRLRWELSDQTLALLSVSHPEEFKMSVEQMKFNRQIRMPANFRWEFDSGDQKPLSRAEALFQEALFLKRLLPLILRLVDVNVDEFEKVVRRSMDGDIVYVESEIDMDMSLIKGILCEILERCAIVGKARRCAEVKSIAPTARIPKESPDDRVRQIIEPLTTAKHCIEREKLAKEGQRMNANSNFHSASSSYLRRPRGGLSKNFGRSHYQSTNNNNNHTYNTNNNNNDKSKFAGRGRGKKRAGKEDSN